MWVLAMPSYDEIYYIFNLIEYLDIKKTKLLLYIFINDLFYSLNIIASCAACFGHSYNECYECVNGYYFHTN